MFQGFSDQRIWRVSQLNDLLITYITLSDFQSIDDLFLIKLNSNTFRGGLRYEQLKRARVVTVLVLAVVELVFSVVVMMVVEAGRVVV